MSEKQSRLSVYVNSQSRDALLAYAERHGVSVTEAVRRHIGVADYVINEIDRGKQVQFKGSGGVEVINFDFLGGAP